MEIHVLLREEIHVSDWRNCRHGSQGSLEAERVQREMLLHRGGHVALWSTWAPPLPQFPQTSCPLLIHGVLLERFYLFTLEPFSTTIMWNSVELALTPRTSLLIQSLKGPHYSMISF